MDDGTDVSKIKNIVKLVTAKEKPPEETPGVNPNTLLKDGINNYDNLIMIGWKDDHFKISWSDTISIEEVYIHLELAKNRLMANMYEF
jgi:hypothetical protein